MLKQLAFSSLIVAGLGVGMADAGNAQDNVQLDITEWELPFEGSRPRDPWVGGDDEIWFVGQMADYVGRLTPSSGEFERFPLEDGTGPHTVISNDQGVWYAGNRAAHIGLLDPDSGHIERFVPPGDGRRDVHSMAFTRDGNIWFTEQGANRVGYFDTDSKAFTMYEVSRGRSLPYGIVVHDDQPWIAMFGTNQLATVKDGELQAIDLPQEETRPRRLAISTQGHVWYGDYATGHIGRYDPETGNVEEWEAPAAGASRPYAVTMDSQDRFWIVETGVDPNRFAVFDTRRETWGETFEIPSGGGTVRHMAFDPDSDTIWFRTDTNTIGKATLE
jgi:virginiamycin B lyase